MYSVLHDTFDNGCAAMYVDASLHQWSVHIPFMAASIALPSQPHIAAPTQGYCHYDQTIIPYYHYEELSNSSVEE